MLGAYIERLILLFEKRETNREQGTTGWVAQGDNKTFETNSEIQDVPPRFGVWF